MTDDLEPEQIMASIQAEMAQTRPQVMILDPVAYAFMQSVRIRKHKKRRIFWKLYKRAMADAGVAVSNIGHRKNY